MPVYRVLIAETVERVAYIAVSDEFDSDAMSVELGDFAENVAVETGIGERHVSISRARNDVDVDADFEQ
ncbi:MAG: hypothetical protein WBA38_09850 [Gordonia sp. (in: high G+C Gram-positive bacteria)]|uniref:hypothetical protein n=1 Tax=Gordonia sp. (in: high G+C Gram-positive bacteria) TaxID=84139 RepID=UPI003C75B19C